VLLVVGFYVGDRDLQDVGVHVLDRDFWFGGEVCFWGGGRAFYVFLFGGCEFTGFSEVHPVLGVVGTVFCFLGLEPGVVLETVYGCSLGWVFLEALFDYVFNLRRDFFSLAGIALDPTQFQVIVLLA
jgi:hypothetical protein